MTYGLILEAAPDVEPVSVAELKAHLRLNTNDENDLLTGWIVAARQLIESYTGRALITQTWKVTADYWLNYLPKAPIQEISEITYYDRDDVEQTYEDYITDLSLAPARIFPTGDAFPEPSTKVLPAITYTMDCGYGDTAEDVPQVLRQAILVLASSYYLHREALVPSMGHLLNVPFGLKAIINNYKVHV